MPEDPNIFAPVWEMDVPEPPIAGRGDRIGARAGASRLGVSLYEIDPGGGMAPYHLHHANEEMLVVLSGSPSVRTPDGVRRLEPGAVVSFPVGPEGAHRVFNPTEEPARVLLISTMVFPDVAEHLDTGGLLAITGPAEGRAFAAEGEQPHLELVLRALHAARERERAGG